MRNTVYQEPDHFSAPVPAGTVSGAPVLVLGAIPAVCTTTEGEGGNLAGRASVKSSGVYSLPCPDAVAAEGTAIYITGAMALTTTASGNTLFGRSIHSAEGIGGTKAGGAGNVNVRLGKV